MFLLQVLYVLFQVIILVAQGKPLENDLRHEFNVEDNMTTTEIILNRGYPAETHLVTTEDGYIIEMHRIPHGKPSPPSPNKPAVFVLHGLICSSADWIIAPNGLGYALADAGYDVWLGNVRGNTYGRQHVSLNPDKDSSFWDFSFDEHGAIDAPAQIRYILQFIKQDKLSYIGHSQGTMSFWIAMETNPDLNDKVEAMFALGPVARLSNVISPIKKIAPYSKKIKLALDLAGKKEFLAHSDILNSLGEELCGDGAPTQEICSALLSAFVGSDPAGFNNTIFPVILSHTPAGTSIQNVDHYAQGVLTGLYAHYDYGRIGNLKHYKQKTPPNYDLSTVKAPVFLMWGQEDFLADPTDVAWLAPQLPNLVENIRIPDDNFNHADFLYHVNATTLCYNTILEKLNRILLK